MANEFPITRHPAWIRQLLRDVADAEARVVSSRLFDEMAAGKLPMRIFRNALVNFYPLVDNFPMYMSGAIRKIPDDGNPLNQLARNWLIGNIHVERRHSEWFRLWAIDFGVPAKTFETRVIPPPEMDAVNNFLWRISAQGTLAECLGAINYAIEGATGLWSKALAKNFSNYRGKTKVRFTKSTSFWVKAHAAYDDKHAPEALELIKMFANTDEGKEAVIAATKRSMEYYALAAEACYAL